MLDEFFMRRCFDLAKKGRGYVAPNPLVGSVIVCQGKIIGEGYHQQYGKAHAEVNAINSVLNKDLLRNSTIYINLEPCAHFGKTPPCADLIVKHKIPKVIIGCIDSYSEVAGKGVEHLKENGINVTVGILELEANKLNKRFFTFHNKKRPYVILKWAQSSDGFIDKERDKNEKGQFWITNKKTKQLVHQWRHEEAGILVGKNTVLIDNPTLTVREIKGTSPTRFVIDNDDQIDLTKYNIGNKDAETIKLKGQTTESILNQIRDENIQSVLIEGGKITLESFIESNLWDEARILIGKSELKTGLKAPTLKSKIREQYYYGDDLIQTYYND